MGQVQLGSLVLQPRRQLVCDGKRLPLGRRALDILSVLAEAKGEIVTKDEIFDAVWPGVIVEENAIQVHIAALRKALGAEAYRLSTVRGLGYRLEASEQPPPVLDRRMQDSVAVLPFANLTGDKGKDYICEGIVRELVATLSRESDLKVPSWQSTFYYRDRAADVRAVARQLGVDTIVEGWVRAGGDRVKVGAQLVDAGTGYHMWSGDFDCTLGELFSLDGELAAKIAGSLKAHLNPARLRTSNMEALEHYLAGCSLMHNAWTPDEVNAARDHFRSAIEMDRRFARAHAMLAHLTFSRVLVGGEGIEAIEEGRHSAELALSLDPTQIDAHTGLAMVGLFTGNWQLLEEHSGLEDICPLRSGLLLAVGQIDQAVAQSRVALANNPLAPATMVGCAMALWNVGDSEMAVRMMANAVAAGWPQNGLGLSFIGADLALREGDVDGAAEAQSHVFSADCRDEARDALRRAYSALSGQGGREMALAALHRFIASDAVQGSLCGMREASGLLIWLHVRLGDIDSAYEIAERLLIAWQETGILEGGSLRLFWLDDMEPFRMDPRFFGLCDRLGFIDYWRRYGLPQALAKHPLADEFIGKRIAVAG